MQRLFKTRDDILGPDEDIVPHSHEQGTAFERSGHCVGIGRGTRAYNLAVSVEQQTQVSAPAAQGKGAIGALDAGVKTRQDSIRVCSAHVQLVGILLYIDSILS